MRWLDYESDVCSIARALEVLGDRWTILILRELFNGVHRFDDLHEHLGVSRDVLTRRLSSLVAEGVVERRAYREPGRRERADYHLTGSGRELQPVLISLLTWGDQHRPAAGGPPVRLEHRDCGAEVGLTLTCAEGHQVRRHDVVTTPLPGARLRHAG